MVEGALAVRDGGRGGAAGATVTVPPSPPPLFVIVALLQSRFALDRRREAVVERRAASEVEVVVDSSDGWVVELSPGVPELTWIGSKLSMLAALAVAPVPITGAVRVRVRRRGCRRSVPARVRRTVTSWSS